MHTNILKIRYFLLKTCKKIQPITKKKKCNSLNAKKIIITTKKVRFFR